jgi:hypothetical protein
VQLGPKSTTGAGNIFSIAKFELQNMDWMLELDNNSDLLPVKHGKIVGLKLES